MNGLSIWFALTNLDVDIVKLLFERGEFFVHDWLTLVCF